MLTQNATSLSRERRAEKVTAAKHALRQFLATLDPLVRRSILDPKSLNIDEMIRAGGLLGSPEHQTARRLARQEYERLAIRVPDEWRRYCRGWLPEYKQIREYSLLGRIPRRGAPRKRREDREGPLIAERVDRATEHLRQGCELRQRAKHSGGSASDDTEIRPRLVSLQYEPGAVQAILGTKTLHGAAVLFVALQTGKKSSAIRKALARAADPKPN
jgi:hypothetical protein